LPCPGDNLNQLRCVLEPHAGEQIASVLKQADLGGRPCRAQQRPGWLMRR
jgi:hypothetical protein